MAKGARDHTTAAGCFVVVVVLALFAWFVVPYLFGRWPFG